MSSQLIRPHPATLTDYGRRWLAGRLELARVAWEADRLGLAHDLRPPIAGGSGGMSNFLQTATLAHMSGQDNASWANLSPTFLALCTAVPDSSKTGTTIVEASYTGYARVSLANTAWSAAVSGGAGGQSTDANSGTITFAACTLGSSTIIGYALCTAATVGNVIAWGSCTSTVVCTTQTPATVAAAALVLGLT